MGDKKLSQIISETNRQKKEENRNISFRTRGIGSEFGRCFKCDCAQGLMSNISAFVDSKKNGEKVVKLFNSHGVYLDYREFEPNWIQVKILACNKHLPDLQSLNKAIFEGVITPKIIEDAVHEPIRFFELNITIRASEINDIIGLMPKITGNLIETLHTGTGGKLDSWCGDTSNYEFYLSEK